MREIAHNPENPDEENNWMRTRESPVFSIHFTGNAKL